MIDRSLSMKYLSISCNPRSNVMLYIIILIIWNRLISRNGCIWRAFWLVSLVSPAVVLLVLILYKFVIKYQSLVWYCSASYLYFTHNSYPFMKFYLPAILNPFCACSPIYISSFCKWGFRSKLSVINVPQNFFISKSLNSFHVWFLTLSQSIMGKLLKILIFFNFCVKRRPFFQFKNLNEVPKNNQKI